MNPLKLAAILAAGLLPGCTEPLDGYPAYSGRDGYAPPGYYGAPGYSSPGYYPPPGYAAPYYQPGYATPFVAVPGWGGRQDSWREHQWRERQWHDRRDYPPQNGGQPFGQQGHGGHQGPPPAPLPGLAGAAPRPMTPPPAAAPPASQGSQQLNQLGFRPSR
jgi:hypothetical protein